MRLEQRDRELAAIGASIGCNCRPCVDHHIPKGREAGLSDEEVVEAVAVSRAIRDEGIALLAPRIDELLGSRKDAIEPGAVTDSSRTRALAALGASVGVNSHPLLRRHIAAAPEIGLSAGEIAAATKMASYVQKRAGEITAEKATHSLEGLVAIGTGPAARS